MNERLSVVEAHNADLLAKQDDFAAQVPPAVAPLDVPLHDALAVHRVPSHSQATVWERSADQWRADATRLEAELTALRAHPRVCVADSSEQARLQHSVRRQLLYFESKVRPV